MHVVVVGAGLAGLSAAGALSEAGHSVTVFDKGPGPGGRMATRRIGAATFDHGAQFFTARDPEFVALVAQWQRSGLVAEWCRGFTDPPDGHPRYMVHGGMNALAKHLASAIDVRCNSLVFGVHRTPSGPGVHRTLAASGTGWSVQLDDDSTHPADALVMTCPTAQTFSLVLSADVVLPEALWRTDYDRTIALLAVLDRPGAVPAPGGVQGAEGFTFIGDNYAKGISAVPAITFHADPDWSAAQWDEPADETHQILLAAARPWLGDAEVIDSQVKRWRFATPRAIWPERCWRSDDAAPLVVAGDAFAGPRVEGAVLSGLAAARSLLNTA